MQALEVPAFRTRTFQALRQRLIRTISPLQKAMLDDFPRQMNDQMQCCCYRCPCQNQLLAQKFTKHPHRAVIVDLETTGIGDGEQIVQIGAVEVIGSMISGNCFDITVRPTVEIGDGACAVHGITNDYVQSRGFPRLESVFSEFQAFVGESLIVCHNANFDIRVLQAEGERINIPFRASSKLCTMKVFRKFFVDPERLIGNTAMKSNLDFVAEFFGMKSRVQKDSLGVETTAYHSAISDAMLTANVYCMMHRMGMVHVHHK